MSAPNSPRATEVATALVAGDLSICSIVLGGGLPAPIAVCGAKVCAWLGNACLAASTIFLSTTLIFQTTLTIKHPIMLARYLTFQAPRRKGNATPLNMPNRTLAW